MSEVTHCPLCFAQLEVRDVAPCAECGHNPDEIEHALAGMHTYAEMRIFGDLSVVLCNYCQLDFGSFDSIFFGVPDGKRIGYEHMQHVRDITDIQIGKDKYCPDCYYRLAFLDFVARAREFHAPQNS